MVDLSHPIGGGVSDGINTDICSMKYRSVREAVEVLRALGPSAKMAKFDVDSAYYNMRVCHGDKTAFGYEMERSAIFRHSVTIWAEIST